MTDRGVSDNPTVPAEMTLQSVGRAYHALSKQLAAEWAPWYRAETLVDFNAVPGFSPSRLEDGLFRLAVLESAGRRILGAKGCVAGKQCPAEWIRDCTVCVEKKHV
jgi:hypothetical protein